MKINNSLNALSSTKITFYTNKTNLLSIYFVIFIVFFNFIFFLLSASHPSPPKLRTPEETVLCEQPFFSKDHLINHVICCCWFTVFSETHSQHSHVPGNAEALLTSFWWQALWRCWFHFAGLSEVTINWCVSDEPDLRVCLKPIDSLKGRRETPDPTIQKTWRPVSKQPELPLHLCSAKKKIVPSNTALTQCLLKMEAQPSNDCIVLNILFRKLTFLFPDILKYVSLCVVNNDDDIQTVLYAQANTIVQRFSYCSTQIRVALCSMQKS